MAVAQSQQEYNNNPIKVLISIPNTGWIHKHCAIAALKLIQDRRYQVTFIFPTHNPFENNLHHIINDFMKGSWEWWLSFDSDNPPMLNPLDLIELNKDIIGCPTPVWHFDEKNVPKGERPIYYNGYKYVPEKDAYTEWPIRKGLQRVDAVGAGCFLINRRVFENPEMRKAPFNRKYNEDGTVDKGSDIAFCERAKENGFEIWMHYDYLCYHFNEIDLNEIGRAFKNLYEP
jgi:hypothetical protein